MEATKKGYKVAHEGDGIDITGRMQYHRGTVQKGLSQTLTCEGGNDVGVVVDSRNMKQELCDELVETGKVHEGDIIKHSYTTQIKSGKKKPARAGGEMITLTTRADTLGITVKQQEISPNLRIRKLTPRECGRLMGFDDYYIDRIQEAGLSNAAQYHCWGDSIIVAVLENIFKEML